MSEMRYPTEIISLPSKGTLYPKGHPLRENGGQLEIKYMTAKEEDILTSTNLVSNGTVFHKFLESIVVQQGMKYTDLVTEDVNAVYIASRVLAYGKMYPVNFICPKCTFEQEFHADLTAFEMPDDLCEVDDNGWYSFETDTGTKISIGALTLGEEIDIERKVSEFENAKEEVVIPRITLWLKRIVKSINGETDPVKLSGMIDNLIVRDTTRIKKEFKALNASVDRTVEFQCLQCREKTEGGLPIGLDFFWPDFSV